MPDDPHILKNGALTAGSKPALSYCTFRPQRNGSPAKKVYGGQRMADSRNVAA